MAFFGSSQHGNGASMSQIVFTILVFSLCQMHGVSLVVSNGRSSVKSLRMSVQSYGESCNLETGEGCSVSDVRSARKQGLYKAMPKSITLTAAQQKAYGEPAVRKLTDSDRVTYGESCDLETGEGCSVSDIRSARKQGIYKQMPKSSPPDDPIPAAMVSDMPKSSPPTVPEDPIPAAKISGMPGEAAEDGDDNAPPARKNENIRLKDAVSLVKQDKMRKRDFVSSRIIRLARKIDPFEECKTEAECEVFISSSDPALVEMMESEITETGA